jgi:hypothetical protein
MARVLYVYAIGEALEPDMLGPATEAVDHGTEFSVIRAAGLTAIFNEVDADHFSQEEIDRRASDVGWLGDIGYRHQNVISALAKKTTVIPLRAFTMFSNRDALRVYLEREAARLRPVLERLRGKEEWTLRLEFDPQQWSDALIRRVPSLTRLNQEVENAAAGKGYLLRRKLEEERKKAARTAEEELLREVEDAVARKLAAPTLVETREQRSGSFPQINLLIERSRAGELKREHLEMAGRYAGDGVSLVLTGPWPPYSFVSK